MKYELLLNCNGFFKGFFFSLHIRTNQENAKSSREKERERIKPVTSCWSDKQSTVSAAQHYRSYLEIIALSCGFSLVFVLIHSVCVCICCLFALSVHVRFDLWFVCGFLFRCCRLTCSVVYVALLLLLSYFCNPQWTLLCRIWFFNQELNDVNEWR